METWREIRAIIEANPVRLENARFDSLIWEKHIEMEERIEKLEKRPAPTPYSERRM